MATEEKNKGGRPEIVLTEEQIIQIEALAAFLTTEQIADYLSIGRSTFYEILQRQPEVAGRYKKGRAKAIGIAANGLMQNIQDGKEASIFFYLKTRAGWSEKQHIELTGKDGEAIEQKVGIVDERQIDKSVAKLNDEY